MTFDQSAQFQAIDTSANFNPIDNQPVMPVDQPASIVIDQPMQIQNVDFSAPTMQLDPSINFTPADPSQNMPLDPGGQMHVVDPTFHNAQTEQTINITGNEPQQVTAPDTTQHQGTVLQDPAQTQDAATHGTSTTHTTPTDFNLGSTAQHYMANSLGDFQTITIDVGGKQEVVSLNSHLTAAELVAAEQVLHGDAQTITISQDGHAIGGTVILDSSLLAAIDHSFSGNIGTLTITQGIQFINAVGLLEISGNLNNYGSLFTASEIAGQASTISANAIFNSVEGMIGSYLGNLSGLYGADPVLNALANITNFGTINSTGNLTLSAPEIANISTAGHTAELSAAQGINFNTAHLTNSGNITAAMGDISATSTSSLLVDNAGGTMQSVLNNVDLSSNNSLLQVMGGNFDSKQLNLKAGHSTVGLQANKVSGVVNAAADVIHLYTSESDLNLGNIDSSGDPTLASQANIIINGTIAPTNGANLAIVSGANILSAAGGQLDTRSTAPGGGNGGNLSLIAGANFTVDGSGNVVLTDSANAGKGSVTGGLIDLSGGNGGTGAVSAITTAGTGATGNAGYVEMVAYNGSTSGSGSIFLPTTGTIDASSANGQRGDVKIISGAGGFGNSVRTGGITGNNITIGMFTPSVGSGMFFDGTGTASNGINSFTTTGVQNQGVLLAQGNINATGDININAGQAAITGNISANGAGGKAGTASLDGGNGHTINITTPTALTVSGSISAVGGGGAGSGSSTPGQAGGKGGNGGQVNITTNGLNQFSLNVAGDINVSGGGGGGGAGSSQTSTATAGGAGGTAGTVKIISTGTAAVSGKILEHDGGAGGAGANVPGAVGAGGGGGSAYGGGGGGGGGGTGNLATDFAAGGGGGFSAVAGSGGGGGGVFGNASGGTLSSGGDGGSATGNGAGGIGDIAGAAGIGQVGGVGGGQASPANGGLGGTSLLIGGTGGGTDTVGQGIGANGAKSSVVTGSGLLDVTAGQNFGTAANPIKVEVSSLKLTVPGSGLIPSGNVGILDTAGSPLNLVSAALGSGVIFNLTTGQNPGTTGADGTINVNGNVTAGTVNFTTNGDAGPNNININAPITGQTIIGGPVLNFSNINLTSNGGTIKTFGPGLLTSTGGALRATGDIIVNTNVGPATTQTVPFNFGATSTNGNVLITQGTNVINLGPSGAASGGSFTLNSQGQINANGAITVDSGTINLNALGGNSGIQVGAAMSTGATTGSINLTPAGTGSITARQGANTAILTSKTINLLSNNNIGSSTAPILTNAVNNGSINTTYGSAGNVFLNDSNTGNVTVNALTASTGTLSVGSQASQLNIPQANFNTVAINNSGPVGNVLLNSSNNAAAIIGNGSGAVTVSATGNIDANANNTGIAGTSTSFTSTNGNIGAARRLQVSGATLTARAANGSVDLETSTATTVNAAGGTNFNLIDTVAGAPVTINGPIAANNVNIETVNATGLTINGDLGKSTATSVNVASGGNINVAAGSSATANSLAINASTNNVSFGSINTNNVNLSTNTGVVSIGTSATPGGTDHISAGGDLTLLNNFNSTNALDVTAGGNLTVGSTSNNSTSLSGSSLTTSGQSITNYGALTGTNQLSQTSTGAGGITNASGSSLTSNGAVALDSSIGNGPITNSGSISGSQISMTAGNGAISNAGAVSGSSFTANGQSFANSNSIAGANSIAVNTTGAAGISNTAGSSLTSSGTVTLDSSAGNGPINSAANIIGSDITLTAGNGAITTSGTVSGSSFTASGQSFANAGSITGSNALAVTTTGASGITNSTGAALSSTGSLTLDSSTANGPISNSGSISGAATQLIAGNGTITNASGGTIVSSDALSFQASTINNQGSASAQTALSFTGPSTGDLTVDGVSGGFTTGNGATLNLLSSGNITAGSGSNSPLSGLTQLGNFNLNAGGNFTSPLNSIALVPDSSGNGGAININANNIVYNGSATRTTPFLLSANGGTLAGNNGGSVNLNLFGTTAQGLTVGNSVGNYKISATGANGGQVNLSTPGNLKVNTAQMTINATSPTGNGSSVTLNGGQNVLLVGNLDTHTGTGSAGPVNITSGSASAFTIDGTKTTTTNGQIGIGNNQGITGNSVTINNAGGVVLANNNVLSGPDAITINGSGLTNNGKVNTDNLTINATGNGNLTTGATGTYQNPPMQTLSLASQNGNFNVSGNVPTANTINISATNGTAAFAGSTSAINAAADASGNGGTININARALTSSDLELNARGTTGNGGNVNLNLTGTTALRIENGEVEIDVTNANGTAGGNVNVANGGNISIDARYLDMGNNFAAGQGANLSLTSGGKLYMDHTSNLGNSLNNLTLASNSTSAFNLGGASSSGNGIGDNNRILQAVNLNISNSGDGIVRGNNSSLKADSITLTALGNIGQSNTPVVLNTPLLNLTSTNGSAYVNLRTTPSTNFVANVANTININATGSINSDQLVSASSLYLNAKGINSGVFPSSTLTTNAGFISAIDTTGSFDIHAISTSPVSLGTVTAGNSASISADGSINTTQAITAGSDLTLVANSGSIQVGNTISADNSVALTALGGGSITDATNGSYKAESRQVNLRTDGGDIGSATRSFRTNAEFIATETAGVGNVFVANTNTRSNGAVTLSGGNVGSFNFVDTNTTNNNHGTLNVNSITTDAADGVLSIKTNERTLSVLPFNILTTNDGNITLQNTFTPNGNNRPSIQIGDNVNIHASSFGSTSTGNVYVVLGNVPSDANLRPGIAPTGGSPTITGTVYFGTAAHPNGSITTSDGVSLNGLERNLVFSTNGQPASQISVGQNTTITADPPIPAGAVAPDFGHLQYATPGSSGAAATQTGPAATNLASTVTAGNIGIETIATNALQASNIPTNTNLPLIANTALTQIAAVPVLSMLGLNLPTVTQSGADTISVNRTTILDNRIGALRSQVAQALIALGATADIQAEAVRLNKVSGKIIGGAANTADTADGTSASTATDSAATKSAPGNKQYVDLDALTAAARGNAFSIKGNTRLSGSVSNVVRHSLDKGAMLMAPDRNTIIDTPYGSVGVREGSVALVIAFNNGLGVYDLHDAKKDSVVITNGNHSTSLTPGRSAVLTNASVKSFEDVNPVRFVGYRRMATRSLSDQTKMYQAEFEMLSMVRGLKPLSGMVSSDNAKTRKTMDSLLKTTAILLELGHGGEQFSYYLPKALMAYAGQKSH